ncbi:MAG: DUF3794 domain-containing protein [Oscillospiraceae bacterium]|jgi:hypothetical protein|nr:DUF3794 domain-containing protein [Oscillospiraceae bacterium]
MELQLNTRSIGSVEIIYDGKLEQAVDSDITLPEYCPDVLRILQCAIEPSITSAQAVGERVTVEGSARVRVLYAGDDSALYSFEQSYPFTRTADINGLDGGAVVSTAAKTEYANGRAVSQRRLDVHGMLGIRLVVRRRKEDAILTGAAGGGVQTRQAMLKASSLEALAEPTFQLSEVIEIEPGAPTVDQVIYRRAVALPSEVKAIKNKLLLKGNLEVRVVYRSRDSKIPVQLVHTMPISQILEAPGITEESANTLRLRTLGLEVTPKPDASGAPRLLDIAATIAAELRGYEPVELPVMTDAYSTQGGLRLDSHKMETRRLVESFQDSALAKADFDMGAGGIQNVQLVQGEVLPVQTSLQPDAIEVSGTVRAHIIYLDGDGQATHSEKEIPFTYRRARHGATGDNLTADVGVELVSEQDNISDSSLELRAELAVAGDVFQTETQEIIGAIAPAEEEEPAAARSPLTIYFAAAGEPLWEIARRYRTTTEAIREENELTGETAQEGQMLLIPGV